MKKRMIAKAREAMKGGAKASASSPGTADTALSEHTAKTVGAPMQRVAAIFAKKRGMK